MYTLSIIGHILRLRAIKKSLKINKIGFGGHQILKYLKLASSPYKWNFDKTRRNDSCDVTPVLPTLPLPSHVHIYTHCQSQSVITSSGAMLTYRHRVSDPDPFFYGESDPDHIERISNSDSMTKIGILCIISNFQKCFRNQKIWYCSLF